MSYCPPQQQEQNSCGRIPPTADYLSDKNPYYAVYQVLPTAPYTGAANPTYAQYSQFPNNNAFSLNPQYPVPQGSNASQVVTNTAGKTVFNNLNVVNQVQQGTNQPIIRFKSDQERMLYLQGQNALRVGLTPSTYLP